MGFFDDKRRHKTDHIAACRDDDQSVLERLCRHLADFFRADNTLNQPNQHVVSAMIEMAKDIYPDVYQDVEDPFAGQ